LAASSSGGLFSLMRRYPLASYFLLAYGVSWLGWVSRQSINRLNYRRISASVY
jgi:hypothetical protein